MDQNRIKISEKAHVIQQHSAITRYPYFMYQILQSILNHYDSLV
jgi:hypothetical protein